MLVLRSGVDILEIERLQRSIKRHGDRLLARIFTSRELAEVGHNPASLAARFAAKEAVSKALGTGIGTVTWKEIEVLRGASGQPVLLLHGVAQQLAQDLGLCAWSISLSHSQTQAIAMVVALGRTDDQSNEAGC